MVSKNTRTEGNDTLPRVAAEKRKLEKKGGVWGETNDRRPEGEDTLAEV